MKTLTLITFFAILLLPLQIFSQIKNKYELDPYRLLQERVNSITNPDEQIKQRLQTDNFSNSESRTIINKRILDNGFLLIEKIYQNWDDSNWINDQKWTYTYDVDNNMIEVLRQYWYSSNWVNAEKWTYTYDVNNNMIECIWQDWDGSNWVNYSKITYTYDVNNNIIEELYQIWDGSNWVNTDKIIYSYDINNNMIEELHQEWDGSNWVNYYKITYTYDVNNNLIEKLWQEWDGSIWFNTGKFTYTYDVNNNFIAELQQYWQGSNWVNRYKFTYSYIPTDVNEFTNAVNTYGLSNNYPNPFNPSTKINYQIPELSFVTLKVYDVLGNEIETLVNEEKTVGNYELTWNAEVFPSGVYFYQLKAGDFIQTKKMVLLK